MTWRPCKSVFAGRWSAKRPEDLALKSGLQQTWSITFHQKLNSGQTQHPAQALSPIHRKDECGGVLRR